MERGFPGFVAFTGVAQIQTVSPADLGQLIAALRAVPAPELCAEVGDGMKG
jgi:hypothetical protein